MIAINRFNKFLRTTLIGGLAAILPLGLIIIFFRWIIGLIEKYLEPLVNLFETDTQISTIIVYSISVVAIIALFFFIGLFIQTRFGNMVLDHIEHTYLMKIPGYKTARDIVRQFVGGTRSFFSEVVLVDIFNSGTLMTAFITDNKIKGNFVTVFVPTGPNPTSGNIYHLPKEKVIKSDISVDVAIKSIISCGAGSAEVFESIKI
ncbi:MAG: DUF502 domain-containing protein [Prolixibacteraceae bacterium]|jgi:uncharacterized membrane protein|nr:DUF502 domain-containing protein [Prolixibacteraceae bacterium]